MPRIKKLRTQIEAIGLDGILITDLKNLRYLTGFTGTTGAGIITAEKTIFVTDFRYIEQAAEQTNFLIRENTQNIYNEISEIFQELKLTKIGIEADDLNVSTFRHLEQLLLPHIVIVEISELVEKLREIKDVNEVAKIERAVEIIEATYEHILKFIKVGMREIEVANEIERFAISQGAEGMSFDTIVASGHRSALPHGVASEKRIETGDLVTIDMGCYYEGYTSDLTRTFAMGSISDQLAEIYHIVLEAHQAVTQAARPGITGFELDKVARDYIKQQGYGESFGHGTGHGIGLDIHEGPTISRNNHQPLQENMVITNEPGIYLAGIGGVRIEDDLIITAKGARSLNKTSKELLII